MEIPHNRNYNNFLMHNPSPKGAVDQFGVEISPQSNLFATSPLKIEDKKPPQKKQKKRSKKRLNAFDSELLYNDEIEEVSEKTPDENNFFIQSDFKLVLSSIFMTLKRVGGKLPLISYFVMKQKKDKLQKTIQDLNLINEDVDELVNLAAPYGEQGKKYETLCENLIRANDIHSKILKEIKD